MKLIWCSPTHQALSNSTKSMAIGVFLFCMFGQNFAKFQPEKYDLDLYKGFSMGKMTQIRQISKFFNSRSPDFYDKVPLGSQEYRKILFFFPTFISNT
jgi:hypothetical protein